MKEKNYLSEERKSKTTTTIPLNGCLMFIILCALAGISVNECKRSEIRLENDRIKHEYLKKSQKMNEKPTLYLDSIKKQKVR